MVKACLDSGEGTEAQCGCVADKLEEGVGEREFAKLADFAAKGDDTGAQEYMNEIMGANPQMAMTLGMSMMGCMAL